VRAGDGATRGVTARSGGAVGVSAGRMVIDERPGLWPVAGPSVESNGGRPGSGALC